MSAVPRSGNAILSYPSAGRRREAQPAAWFRRICASVLCSESARSVFAVTLNFVFLLIVGVGAVVTAILFLAFHQAFAPGVSTLVLTLSFHVSTSRACNSAASESKGDATLSTERFGLQPVMNGSYDRDFRCRRAFCAASLANVSQKLASIAYSPPTGGERFRSCYSVLGVTNLWQKTRIPLGR